MPEFTFVDLLACPDCDYEDNTDCLCRIKNKQGAVTHKCKALNSCAFFNKDGSIRPCPFYKSSKLYESIDKEDDDNYGDED